MARDAQHELVKGILQQDSGCLETLIARHAAELYALVSYILGSLGTPQDAEEVVSDVFVAFGAEELGLVGSREYVMRHQEDLENVVAVINYDVTGEETDFLFGTPMGMPYPPTITLTATPTPTPERLTTRFFFFDLDSSIPVTQQWKHLDEPYGIVVDTPDWLMDLAFEVAADLGYTLLPNAPYASDHMPFLLEDVPATMIAWWPDRFIHSPDDTLDTLQIDRLEMSAVLGYEMVLRLAR